MPCFLAAEVIIDMPVSVWPEIVGDLA